MDRSLNIFFLLMEVSHKYIHYPLFFWNKDCWAYPINYTFYIPHIGIPLQFIHSVLVQLHRYFRAKKNFFNFFQLDLHPPTVHWFNLIKFKLVIIPSDNRSINILKCSSDILI
uniref:Uncharacterized protein n=1 Tax=Lepeophtheirus salmonis TaxID=72036 RepID=A0A0K2U929_LEPSM